MNGLRSSFRRSLCFAWLLLGAAGWLGGATAPAAEPKLPAGRVMFIGIDGCRFDAVEKARTPNLDRLIGDGCYSDRVLILGERYRRSETVSGPGWTSLLTGVWADKHGIDDNKFRDPHLNRFPHFFRRVKQADFKGSTISIASWPPISETIVSNADVNHLSPHDDLYVPGDRETAKLTADMLRGANPIAMFVYFGQVDEHGHKYGFSPDVPEYVAAIERVDEHVGMVIQALEKRKYYAEENWLVLVSSDHGGLGKDHGGGHAKPEILNSFAIVSGAAAKRGQIQGQAYIVDVPVTALAHLGVGLDPQWELDGKPIGLKAR